MSRPLGQGGGHSKRGKVMTQPPGQLWDRVMVMGGLFHGG